jgi:hypothetical protein
MQASGPWVFHRCWQKAVPSAKPGQALAWYLSGPRLSHRAGGQPWQTAGRRSGALLSQTKPTAPVSGCFVCVLALSREGCLSHLGHFGPSVELFQRGEVFHFSEKKPRSPVHAPSGGQIQLQQGGWNVRLWAGVNRTGGAQACNTRWRGAARSSKWGRADEPSGSVTRRGSKLGTTCASRPCAVIQPSFQPLEG